jgi:hypothetical protein
MTYFLTLLWVENMINIFKKMEDINTDSSNGINLRVLSFLTNKYLQLCGYDFWFAALDKISVL